VEIDILSISEAYDRLGGGLCRVLSYRSGLPDGPPDCAETVASNGYSLKKIALHDDVFGVRFAHLCCKEKWSDVEHIEWDNHLGVSRRSMFMMGDLCSRGGARSGSRWKG